MDNSSGSSGPRLGSAKSGPTEAQHSIRSRHNSSMRFACQRCHPPIKDDTRLSGEVTARARKPFLRIETDWWGLLIGGWHLFIRRITVTDALVDTGATMLSLPRHMIRDLGLAKRHTRRVRTSRGLHDADIYDTVRLTIGGRDCPTDVIEVPDDTPVLVGQIPLEALDYVVDLRARRLIGNPDHGGELMYDLYFGPERCGAAWKG